MKFKTFRNILTIALATFMTAGFAWADSDRIFGEFSGENTDGSDPAALFEGNFRATPIYNIFLM